MTKGARISPCGTYRYSLWREWGNGTWEGPGPTYRCLFVMLNPSTADATEDDPTIRKCIGFARQWGYGGVEVVNVFAYRATDPKQLRKLPTMNIVGPDNDAAIADAVSRCGRIVAAWGAEAVKVSPTRVAHVRGLLQAPGSTTQHSRPVLCLKKTKDGHPTHPLYVPYAKELEPFAAPSTGDE